MTFRSLLVAGSSLVVAVTLTGCGEVPPEIIPPAPAPAGAEIQYFRFPNHSEIVDLVPECNYWEKANVGRKVDSVCCNTTDPRWQGKHTSTPPDSRLPPDGTSTTSCYVRERADPNAGTYIRNYFGCENALLVAAEGCTPDGVSMGNGYPMNRTYANDQAVDGSTTSCNCESLYGGLPRDIGGPAESDGGAGCYVALTSYSELGSETDLSAAFLKISTPTACGVASGEVEYI